MSLSTLLSWDGLLWLLLLLGPLLFFQRRLHFELQAVFLLITRREEISIGLFSLLFFPGVLLHETSHFLMARILLVRTGRFSLFPKVLPEGRLQLGFVETEATDPLRDSLIGAAPLVAGGTAIAIMGLNQLGLSPLVAAFNHSDSPAFWSVLAALPEQPDFWLWFYLVFAISTTMLPSASDRRGWLPVALVMAALLALALVAGAGPWMAENLAPWLNAGLRALAAVFGISLVLHIILWLPTRFLRSILCRSMGVTIQTKF